MPDHKQLKGQSQTRQRVMTMTKLIVVLGATGNQGGSVVKSFLRESDWTVRGLTRDISKPSSQVLEEQGVEMVNADLDDKTSLVAAFQGAHAIFAVTDFWQFAKDPITYEQAIAQGKQPNEVCYDRELVQSKNMINAAADASVVTTLERFIHSTLSDTKKWSNNTIRMNLHFDGKAEASKYLEATFPQLAARTSYLQVGFYMTNWRMSPVLRMQREENGKDFFIPKPSFAGGHPVPFVDPPQDVGPFVRALVLVAPVRSNMFGYSREASMAEYCECWTLIMRERGLIAPDAICIENHPLTLEQIEKSRPGGFGKEIADSAAYTGTFGWCGADPTVKSPKELGVKMSDLSTLEDFIRKEDWTDVLK